VNNGRIAIFAPSPLLTITIESGSDRPEVHLHGGGQGFWVARLAATLGADVVLCCALGGEPGGVLRGLIETETLTLRAVMAEAPNGVYIHDRRSGSRIEVVSVESRPLDRHASDELYGIALGAGLDANLTLITGTQPVDLLQADLYRRLVSDLRANGRAVIADLTGPPLNSTLEGGIELLRISEEEMLRDDYIATRRGLGTGTRQEIERLAAHVTVRPLP
jgi:Fructose-1-phosphate kinase and related fructose-6-phosphate kinase (PfkB)